MTPPPPPPPPFYPRSPLNSVTVTTVIKLFFVTSYFAVNANGHTWSRVLHTNYNVNIHCLAPFPEASTNLSKTTYVVKALHLYTLFYYEGNQYTFSPMTFKSELW